MNIVLLLLEKFNRYNVSRFKNKKCFLKKLSPGIAYFMCYQGREISDNPKDDIEFDMKDTLIDENGLFSKDKLNDVIDIVDEEALKNLLMYFDDVDVNKYKPRETLNFYQRMISLFWSPEEEEKIPMILRVIRELDLQSHDMNNVEKKYTQMIIDGDISSFKEFIEFK